MEFPAPPSSWDTYAVSDVGPLLAYLWNAAVAIHTNVLAAVADVQAGITILLERITDAVATAAALAAHESNLATAQADLSTLLTRITDIVASATTLASHDAKLGTAQGDLTTLVSRVTGIVALGTDLATLDAKAALESTLAAIKGGDWGENDTMHNAVAYANLSNQRIGDPGSYGGGSVLSRLGDDTAIAKAAALTTAQGDLTTLLARVTAAVATASALSTHDGKLDTAQGNLTTILSRVTEAVATASALSTHDGKLDTAQGNLTTLLARVTEAVATASALSTHDGKLDTAQGNLTTLLTRVTEAVATAANLATLDGKAALETTLGNRPTLTQIEASTVLAKQTELLRALGLVHENMYLDTIVTDSNGNLTSGRLRSYSAAGSVGTDADVLATYTITAVYTGTALTSYKVVKT
jgi:hypothetical protein